MNLILIGPSGSGKDTQAELLEKKFGWKNISMGHLLREEAAQDTSLGKEIKKYLDQGSWAPLFITTKILFPIIDQLSDSGFILNGFPRMLEQAEELDNYLKNKQTKIDLVIHFTIRPEVIIERRKKLWSEGKTFYPGENRSDETEEVIRHRFDEYFKTINPILKYYRLKGILKEVDGERPIEEIHEDIKQILNVKPACRQAGVKC